MPRVQSKDSTPEPPKKTTRKAAAKKAAPAKKAAKKAAPKAKADPVEEVAEQTETSEPAPKPDVKPPKAAKKAPLPPRPKTPPKVEAATLQSAKLLEPNLSMLQSLPEAEDYLNIVLYGDHGVGKSSSLASLARRGTLWIVDNEGSIKKDALRRLGFPVDNIHLWQDWTLEGLETLYITAKAELERDPNSIYAIGIDSSTGLAQYWLEAAVDRSLNNPAKKSKNPTRDQWDVERGDYGVLAEQFKAVIARKLFTLPCHVVVTAHAKRAENDAGVTRITPSLPAAASSALTIPADWVLHIERKKVKDQVTRTVSAAPHGLIEAKERLGVLPDEFDTPLLDEMFGIWEEQMS